nr:methyltransferase domain-containing protein [Sphingorhabdus lutea]
MKHSLSTFLFAALFCAPLLNGCSKNDEGRIETARDFPKAFRPVSPAGSTEFSTEAAREEAGEARTVMDWADIKAGMTVSDIGAGEGYYTVRLAERVGAKGRVVAQDISRDTLKRLGDRITRERWDNVSISEGAIDDPKLPANSFDRVLMVHMYHEVEEPYALLWRLYPALRKGGQVIVVDRDLPTDQHGIPPVLLFCEFEALGFRLMEFAETPDVGAYFARFERSKARPSPKDIKSCAIKNKNEVN